MRDFSIRSTAAAGLAFVLACLLVAGCGDDEESTGSCGDIDACFVGSFFADCGGMGEPRLGCEGSLCYWFSGGCVATGFTVSGCSNDDICCRSNWPFRNAETGGLSLASRLYSRGYEPWTRHRSMALTFSEDPGLAGAAVGSGGTGTLDCQGGTAGRIDACRQGLDIRAGMGDTLTLTVSPSNRPLGGTWLVVEADPVRQQARACIMEVTDAFTQGCSSSRPPICAEGGSFEIERWPASSGDLQNVRGVVSATFDGGSSLELRF